MLLRNGQVKDIISKGDSIMSTIDNELKSIMSKVSSRLFTKNEFNGDDMLLYADMCEEYTKENDTYTEDVKTAIQVMREHSKYNLPNYATVMRSRQAIQEKFPNLKIKEIQHKRDERQIAFQEFFGN